MSQQLSRGTPYGLRDVQGSLMLPKTTVHRSSIAGEIGEEISAKVVSARISSDIDRQGSKNVMDIEVVGNHDALPASSWVTVMRSIAREGAPAVLKRQGTFELGEPSISTVSGAYHVSNTGSDIVNLLERSILFDTFYTPPRGWVMKDVENLLRMVGITSMGPNLHQNGSFEDGVSTLTGWVIWRSNSAYTVDAAKGGVTPTPDGKYMMRHRFTSGEPAGSFMAPYHDVTLPGNLKKVFISGMYYRKHSPLDTYISLVWIDAGGTTIRTDFLRDTPGSPSLTLTWVRTCGVFDRPDGAVKVRVYTRTEATAATTSTWEALWDDIQVRSCTGDPLPASMLALPPSTATAANRIQHLSYDTRLPAVNDRLKSIGMMAINATPDNKYTTRKLRDVRRDSAVRTYDLVRDITIVGSIEKTRSSSNAYNRVFAVKEDYETGNALVAVAENTSPSDEWSIHNRHLPPRIVTVNDAVDIEALQEIADAELARATVRDTISFTIADDRAPGPYDIIRITGPTGHPAVGKWAVESMEKDLMRPSAVATVMARRTREEFNG